MNADPGGDRKERKKEEDVINNVIITSPTTPTPRLIVTFSVSPSVFKVWQDFEKVAIREAGRRGRSEVIVKALGEYVKRHNLGNPQVPLTTYTGPLSPSPMNVECNYIRGATSGGLVLHHIFKEGSWQNEWVQGIRCYSCPNNKLKKKS